MRRSRSGAAIDSRRASSCRRRGWSGTRWRHCARNRAAASGRRRYSDRASVAEISMTRLVFAALLATLLVQQDPQRPVFRAGAHFVRVDAYPLRNGLPIPGLTAKAFQIFEAGQAQAIEMLEWIEFQGFTPETQRQDPNSQRDAFEQAKDPSYRVFVLYLDIYHVDVAGSHRIRQPIINMLNRMLGPKDLFGVLTPIQTPKDLILQRQSLQIQDQLNKYWYWGQQGSLMIEPVDEAL